MEEGINNYFDWNATGPEAEVKFLVSIIEK